MVPVLPLIVPALFLASVLAAFVVALRRQLFAHRVHVIIDPRLSNEAHTLLKVFRKRLALGLSLGAVTTILLVVLVSREVFSITGGVIVMIAVVGWSRGFPIKRKPTVRVAGLAIRRAHYRQAGIGPAFIVSALLLVLITVSYALMPPSSSTNFESSPGVTVMNIQSSAPHAGWMLAAQVIGALVVFALFVAITIQRIARAAEPLTAELQGLNDGLRQALNRWVLLSAIAVVTLSAGSVVWIAGINSFMAAQFSVLGPCQQRSVSENTIESMCPTVGNWYSQPTYALGLVHASIGMALIAAALALMVFSLRQVFRAVTIDVVRAQVDA
jgi:hypothetical protein